MKIWFQIYVGNENYTGSTASLTKVAYISKMPQFKSWYNVRLELPGTYRYILILREESKLEYLEVAELEVLV